MKLRMERLTKRVRTGGSSNRAAVKAINQAKPRAHCIPVTEMSTICPRHCAADFVSLFERKKDP